MGVSGFWRLLGVRCSVGVAGGGAAVPRGQATILAATASVHMAGTADEGIFFVGHCWAGVGGGSDGLPGGVLPDRQPFWSMGTARIELRRFCEHGDSVDRRNRDWIAGGDQ